MDVDFENLYFLYFLDSKFLDFQVPRFPKSGPGQAGLGPRAGPGLGLGPGGPSGTWLGPMSVTGIKPNLESPLPKMLQHGQPPYAFHFS